MLEPGQLIDGKYRVERLLGKGGMGAVFEGYHTLVDRRVAIKVLLPDATGTDVGSVRFEREVRATGRIGSDHILEVYDVGVLPDGSRYMVSEFLDGETLTARLDRLGSLAPVAVAELMLQLLDGLGAAHDKGIVHRDLKPDNLFVLHEKAGRTDFLKIIDFGISKYELDTTTSMSMTATGTVLGTPYYLSPEQARGQRDIDYRSDLYAVGVIMYQAIAGRVPMNAESFNELLFKIALETPPPLQSVRPELDPVFSGIVERAMAKDRDQRYQSAREMREALANWLGRPVPSLPIPSGSAAGAAPWPGSKTVTGSVALPTNTNFGLTSGENFRRRSPLRLVLLGLGVVGVGVIAAVLLFGRSGSDVQAAAPAVASSGAPARASAPPAVVVAPVETSEVNLLEPPREPAPSDESELATGSDREPTSAVPTARPRTPERAAPRPHRTTHASAASPAPRPTATAAAAPTPTTPAATTTASPAPATTERHRRDFGY